MNNRAGNGSNHYRRNTGNQSRYRQFTGKMQKKLVVLFLIVLLAFMGLSARLIYINNTNGEQYK